MALFISNAFQAGAAKRNNPFVIAEWISTAGVRMTRDARHESAVIGSTLLHKKSARSRERLITSAGVTRRTVARADVIARTSSRRYHHGIGIVVASAYCRDISRRALSRTALAVRTLARRTLAHLPLAHGTKAHRILPSPPKKLFIVG